MSLNYKQKYLDIRDKMIEAIDVAFRDGYALGLEKGETQAAQQQQAEQEQAMMQEQQAMGGMPGEGGMPDEEAAAMGEEAEGGMLGGDEMMDPEAGVPGQGGTELDDSIGELEGLVQKGEKPKVSDLRKAVEKLSGIRRNELSKANKRQKKINSAQSQFVSSILKSWDEKSKDVTEDLEETIKTHGFKVD